MPKPKCATIAGCWITVVHLSCLVAGRARQTAAHRFFRVTQGASALLVPAGHESGAHIHTGRRRVGGLGHCTSWKRQDAVIRRFPASRSRDSDLLLMITNVRLTSGWPRTVTTAFGKMEANRCIRFVKQEAAFSPKPNLSTAANAFAHQQLVCCAR